MDIDLIIINILNFLPRFQIRITRLINSQWNQIVTYLYPKKFTWKDNAYLINKISIKQQNQFEGAQWMKLNEVFCSFAGLKIFLFLNKIDNKLYVSFKDLIFGKNIYRLLPSSVKTNSKLLPFFLPHAFSTDSLQHLVLLLKYNDHENTFVDYTDLDNIMIFKNQNQFTNFFAKNSIHHALCQSLGLYDFHLGQTTIADFPFADHNKLSSPLYLKIGNYYGYRSDSDGSIFVIRYADNFIQTYKGHDFKEIRFEGTESPLRSPLQFVCFKFVIKCHLKVFEIYNIDTGDKIIEIPKNENDSICHTINLTKTHFLMLISSDNTIIGREYIYYIVDINRKVYSKTSYNFVVVYYCKVEQINDDQVVVHYYSLKKYCSVSINLKHLCFD